MLLPTRPEMEGKNRWQDKDTKGAFLIQGIIKSAREGDGFSEYWTNKPSIGRDAPKLSFNLVLDKYQWVVGTGFYIDDIDNELATLRSEREETMYGSLKTGVLFILVILGVTLAATVVIGNRVTRPLADAVAALNDIADGDGDLTQRLKVQSKDEVGQLAAAQVRAFADEYAGRHAAFDHTGAGSTGVEVDKALVHHGGAFADISAQAQARGVSDTHAVRHHVVGHFRELVDREDFQQLATQAGFQLTFGQLAEVDGALAGPGHVRQQRENAGEVQAVGFNQAVRQQVQLEVGLRG